MLNTDNTTSKSKPIQPITSQSVLNRLSEEILTNWEAQVRREVTTAGDLLGPALRNSLPIFLNHLSIALSENDPRGLTRESSDMVRMHAGERARESEFGPAQLIQEYQVLRDVVTSLLEKEFKLSENDYETIQKSFDQAIQEALMEFFLVHAELREQFMATLSHDLRNPIGVAKMGAQLICEEAQNISDSKIRDEIIDLSNRIESNMKRADRMIQDLLDASVLRIGERLPIQISQCNLKAVVQEVVSELAEKSRERINVIGETINGFWDCSGIQRALENLIKNAIKYGAADAPITVELSKNSKQVRLSVHNFGNPIPESEQGLIFKTFRRAKVSPSNSQLGWGIGLSLVKAVSESHGGNVQVESTQDAGTTFTMNLPINPENYH